MTSSGRIVALLVKRVDIGAEGLKVLLRVNDRTGLACEMWASGMAAGA